MSLKDSKVQDQGLVFQSLLKFVSHLNSTSGELSAKFRSDISILTLKSCGFEVLQDLW